MNNKPIGPYKGSRIVLCSADARSQSHQPQPAAYFFPKAKWVGASRNAAQDIGCRFVVLTTKHGMVDADDVITHYDLKAEEHPEEVSAIWRKTVPVILGHNQYDIMVFYGGGVPRQPYLDHLLPILGELGIDFLTFGRPNMYDAGKIRPIIELIEKGTTIEELQAVLTYPDYLFFAPCPDSPNSWQSWKDSGKNFFNKGDFDQALKHFQKCLEIQLDILGQNHPDVAASYNNLGTVYGATGYDDRALECHEKALKIQMHALGRNHPDVATSYSNLGLVYGNKGYYDRALQCHKKALGIWIQALGQRHPHVALAYSNIGMEYAEQGKTKKAVTYLEKAVQIYFDAGLAHHNNNDFDLAIEYYNNALEIQLDLLGEEHPSLVAIYNNLGTAHEGKDDDDTAIEFFKKAIALQINNSSHNPSYLADGYYNLGNVYFKKGVACTLGSAVVPEKHMELTNDAISSYDQAIGYHEKALEIRIDVWGQNHPAVANSYHGLAENYFNKREYNKAIEYIQKALKIYTATFGETHPDTVMAKEYLETYKTASNHDERKPQESMKASDFRGDLKIFLEDYNYQPALTSRLDHLEDTTVDQLLINEIVLWKLNRYVKINQEVAEQLTEIRSLNAGEHRDGELLLNSLININGVDLAMASTILRFMNSKVFQIIDRHAYRALYGRKYPLYPSSPTERKISLYFDYLDELIRLCENKRTRFDTIDRLLYIFDKKENGPL